MLQESHSKGPPDVHITEGGVGGGQGAEGGPFTGRTAKLKQYQHKTSSTVPFLTPDKRTDRTVVSVGDLLEAAIHRIAQAVKVHVPLRNRENADRTHLGS